MPIAAGSRLGPYEILAPLGAGGMGEVYRAHDPRLGRDVAIKVLPEHLTRNADLLARLEREAQAVAALNHPNIVTLHSLEQAGEHRFLTMELVEGESLATLIPPGGLPLRPLLEVAIALAEALAAAHAKRILHRDLKPGNVMLTRDGRVKVLDFGLAKRVSEPPDSDPDPRHASVAAPLTEAGMWVGTPPYASPEQLCGSMADTRTDLFALGVVIYELTTGQRPFGGSSAAELSWAVQRDDPTPMHRLRSDVPEELERTVRHCLEKEPDKRIQTAREVGDRLRELKRGLERAQPGDTGGATPGTRGAAAHGRLEIAVLPFANMTGDASNEYVSDGLAEEILNVLAKIRGLRVAARTSSFQFKGRNEDATTIGRKLNVNALLEGSVRTVGRRARIAVQLVDVAGGYHLWSETYDRTLEDIIAVQEEIARSVVQELRGALMGRGPDWMSSVEARADVAEAVKGRGASGEAHRLFLQGRFFVDRRTREDSAKGIGYLRAAVEIDAGHALAWTELSRAYANEAGHGWTPVAQGYARAREAARRALALEPRMAEVHAMLAWIHTNYDWNWTAAAASVRHALELAPGNAAVLRVAGVVAQHVGRLDEAVECYRGALAQDPLNASAHHNLGSCCRAADRLEEAEAAFRTAHELAPQRIGTQASLALVALARGRGDEALAEAEREPEEMYRLWALSLLHHARGDHAGSDKACRTLTARHADGAADQIAMVHAFRGEVDEAFTWLDRAYDQRDAGLAKAKCEPLFRSLHDDPRWAAFVKKMGF